jgi:hypothetical protein
VVPVVVVTALVLPLVLVFVVVLVLLVLLALVVVEGPCGRRRQPGGDEKSEPYVGNLGKRMSFLP